MAAVEEEEKFPGHWREALGGRAARREDVLRCRSGVSEEGEVGWASGT